MPILDNYLSVLEASRRLKVHPETVKRLCRQGDLPANKIHNTWLINKDTLDNFAGTYNPKVGARKRLIKREESKQIKKPGQAMNPLSRKLL